MVKALLNISIASTPARDVWCSRVREMLKSLPGALLPRLWHARCGLAPATLLCTHHERATFPFRLCACVVLAGTPLTHFVTSASLDAPATAALAARPCPSLRLSQTYLCHPPFDTDLDVRCRTSLPRARSSLLLPQLNVESAHAAVTS
jgi:hypothetical protein